MAGIQYPTLQEVEKLEEESSRIASAAWSLKEDIFNMKRNIKSAFSINYEYTKEYIYACEDAEKIVKRLTEYLDKLSNDMRLEVDAAREDEDDYNEAYVRNRQSKSKLEDRINRLERLMK